LASLKGRKFLPGEFCFKTGWSRPYLAFDVLFVGGEDDDAL
jgi:hypothetical protein